MNLIYPCRSILCAPAYMDSFYEKAIEGEADIIHYDLEDSVPQRLKKRARESLKVSLSTNQVLPTAVRINCLSTSEGIRDMLFIRDNFLTPSIIILPKINSPFEIELVDRLLDEIESPSNLFLVFETVRGFKSIGSIVTCSNRVKGLIFGVADLAAELGTRLDCPLVQSLKFDLAIAALSNDLLAIDSPCFKIDDMSQLQHEIEQAKSIGFSGKIAIHPTQISLINSLFKPLQEDVQQAQELVEAFKQNTTLNVARFKGGMIGPPFLKNANKLLSRYSCFLK